MELGAEWLDRIRSLALYLPALLLGIGLHEWTHAWTAWRCGDETPEEQGRLSLNPLSHFDPLGTVMMVVAALSGVGLGWGKPVEIRLASFRDPVRGEMLVAVAGVLMNLTLAGATGFAFYFFRRFLDSYGAAGWPPWAENLRVVLLMIVWVNLSLTCFNLLPIPPLDGSRVLKRMLSAENSLVIARMEPFGILILLVLLQFGVIGVLLEPVKWLRDVFLSTRLLDVIGVNACLGVAWSLFLRALRSVGVPGA